MNYEIKNIFELFDVGGSFSGSEPISSGHINDTFRIDTEEGPSYVLQRINEAVFTDPRSVVENKITVARHLQHKLGPDSETRVLNFHKTSDGKQFLREPEGRVWNLMDYIEDSRVYLKVPSTKVAREAGRAFGEFLAMTADLDPSKLHVTLPGFHSMSHRFEEFDESLKSAKLIRIERAAKLIENARELRVEMHVLEELVDSGELPVRITHNDTKISNALFSPDDEAISVIDLDTVMPGVVAYDFGDAVRTICSHADEDEPDISKVDFSLEYFRAFVHGFIVESGLELEQKEIESLAISAKVMTFIVGLRFLTDYLNNDVYFDTAYDAHNLDRARSQFRRAGLIGENLSEMEKIIEEACLEKNAGATA